MHRSRKPQVVRKNREGSRGEGGENLPPLPPPTQARTTCYDLEIILEKQSVVSTITMLRSKLQS